MSHCVVEWERPCAANVGQAGWAVWLSVAGVSCMTSVQGITVSSWERSCGTLQPNLPVPLELLESLSHV